MGAGVTVQGNIALANGSLQKITGLRQSIAPLKPDGLIGLDRRKGGADTDGGAGGDGDGRVETAVGIEGRCADMRNARLVETTVKRGEPVQASKFDAVAEAVWLGPI